MELLSFIRRSLISIGLGLLLSITEINVAIRIVILVNFGGFDSIFFFHFTLYNPRQSLLNRNLDSSWSQTSAKINSKLFFSYFHMTFTSSQHTDVAFASRSDTHSTVCWTWKCLLVTRPSSVYDSWALFRVVSRYSRAKHFLKHKNWRANIIKFP